MAFATRQGTSSHDRALPGGGPRRGRGSQGGDVPRLDGADIRARRLAADGNGGRPLAMMETEAAVDRIRAWGEARDWCGYDPYDALRSPFAPALTLGTRLGRRVLTQAVKLSPLNLRPVLRIPRARNEKAIALVASAYSLLGEREAAAR